MKIALFPGTFDPITMGHVDVIERAMKLFDKVVVGIGVNSNKTPMFSLEQRIAWIQQLFAEKGRVEARHYEGLTVNFCKEIEASYIIRGIRSVGDFEYERAIADMNKELAPQIETIFLACKPEYSSYSSTIVRDIIKHKGDYSRFVPEVVVK